MRRLILIGLTVFGVLSALWAQNLWEGQVFRAEPGVLPEAGLYAAANDFPRNTFLEITLPRTGKTVLVEVLKRNIEGIEGPVLVLSSQAAAELGLDLGESAPARATVSSTLRSLPSTLAQERPVNPDPETNPALLVQRPQDISVPEIISPQSFEAAPVQEAPQTVTRQPQPQLEPMPPLTPSTVEMPPVSDEGPRTVTPRIPSEPVTRALQTQRPEFVGTPQGDRPVITRSSPPVEKPAEPTTPTFTPTTITEDRPRTSPANPRLPAQRSLPLLAAQPPEGPRVSPQSVPPRVAETHPDAPPAPREAPERGPRAVGPSIRLPEDDRIVIVPPEPQPTAVVSPEFRMPMDSSVVILPRLPDQVRVVRPTLPPQETEVADRPSVVEQPRVVRRQSPDFMERMVDLPPIAEQPRTVKLNQPPLGEIADLPSPYESPRTVNLNQPPLGEIADLPSPYESPRTVQPSFPEGERVADMPVLEEGPRLVRPTLPEGERVADVPTAGESPRSVQPSLPTTERIADVPTAIERPREVAQIPPPQETSPTPPAPVVPSSRPQQPSAGVTQLTQGPTPSGRRYVSRPQKPEGDIVGDIAIVDQLQPGGFYVQLGSYRDEATLLSTLERVRTYVPFVVHQTTRGMRLLAGPVTEGQVGLLLRHYQGQGFRDAYIVRPQR